MDGYKTHTSQENVMMLDVAQLLALEHSYNEDLVHLYLFFIQKTDRYSLSKDEDLYLCVSFTHFMQQLISQLLAVSFVGEVVKKALETGIAMPDDGLSRRDFVAGVGKLTEMMEGPPGRDLKLPRAAARAWDMAMSCSPGGVKLGQAQFERWVRGSDVAWPAPEVDVLDFFATVQISEAVNGNDETGYMRSNSKEYPLRMQEHMVMFFGTMPGIVRGFRNNTPMNMRGKEAALRHVVCGCPTCPTGNICERVEYEHGSAFRVGRCPLCVDKVSLCCDQCKKCQGKRERCSSCESRRRLKPRGCPSNGEILGYGGAGCTGQECRCPTHQECRCIKCMLGVKVGELLSPQRGLKLMRIDAADMPADVVGPEHCVGLDTAALLLREGSAMRALVREAKEAEVLCDKHRETWRPACVPECSSCLLKRPRPESWRVLISGEDMEMPSCAVSLCNQCSLKVYGILKVMKRARMDCALCRSAMDVLVALLARMDLERYVSMHVATEAASVDRTVVPLPEPEAVLVNKRCTDEYLEHTVGAAKLKVRRTCAKGDTLASLKRCDTSKFCCPSRSGVPVAGSYDKNERGIEQSSGVPMQFMPSSKYVMGEEGVVLTTLLATEAGLDQRYIDAAKQAFAQAYPDKILNRFLSPSYRK